MLQNEREATLTEVLRGRDERVQTQRELLALYSLPVVSFTVNVAGAVKLCNESRYVHAQGIVRLGAALAAAGIPVVRLLVREPPSGPEAFFVVDCDAHALKTLTCAVEEATPIGRLFDMDVLTADRLAAISRAELGYARRMCLICENDAIVCARTRAHDLTELRARVTQLVATDRNTLCGKGGGE